MRSKQTFLAMAIAASSAIGGLSNTCAATGHHSGILSLAKGSSANGACALLADHHVQCWGEFYRGVFSDRSVANIVGIGNATALAVGNDFGCALLADETVWCWGDNTYGELGDGTTVSRTEAKPAEASGMTAIATGENHACALFLSGIVYCWGNNFNGEVGNYNVPIGSTTNSPEVVTKHDFITNPPLADVISISLGGNDSCAMQSDGTAHCWGWNRDGQLGDGTASENVDSYSTVKVGATSLVMIDGTISVGGRSHVCALLNDPNPFHVSCWGSNANGELGNATFSSTDVNGIPYNVNPTEVEFLDSSRLVNVQSVSAGGNFACGLLVDHTIACWGQNDLGQLGDPPQMKASTHSPVAVYAPDGSKLGDSASTQVIQVASGLSHACALLLSNQVYCWGDNQFGQLGQTLSSGDTNTDVPVLVPVDAPLFTDSFEKD